MAAGSALRLSIAFGEWQPHPFGSISEKKKIFQWKLSISLFFFPPSHYLMSNSIFSEFSAIIQPYSLKRDVFCDLFFGCTNALLTIILHWSALIICIPVLMCHNQDLSLHFFKPFISVSIQEAYEAFKKKEYRKVNFRICFILMFSLFTGLNYLMQHLFFSYFGWIEKNRLVGLYIAKAVRVPCTVGTMHEMSYIQLPS